MANLNVAEIFLKSRKTQQLSETFNLAKLRSLAKGLTFSRLHFKPHYLKPHDQVKGAKGISNGLPKIFPKIEGHQV